jgi:hypothetical protein
LISSTTSSAGAALVDHDLGPFSGAEQRDLAADPAPGAGDDDDFILQ